MFVIRERLYAHPVYVLESLLYKKHAVRVIFLIFPLLSKILKTLENIQKTREAVYA